MIESALSTMKCMPWVLLVYTLCDQWTHFGKLNANTLGLITVFIVHSFPDSTPDKVDYQLSMRKGKAVHEEEK